MGKRVSRSEKLDFCLRGFYKVYKQLDKHFDKFIQNDISFSTSGNSLYDVVLSSTFTPLKNTLLVDLNFDVYRKGTNTLVHRLTLSEEVVSSSTQVNGISIGFAPIFTGLSVPCYRGKPQSDLAREIDVTEVDTSDIMVLLGAIPKFEILDAFYNGLLKQFVFIHDFCGVRK